MATTHRTKRLRTSILMQGLPQGPQLERLDRMDSSPEEAEEEEEERVRQRRPVYRKQDLATVLPAEVALQVFEKLAPADLGRCAVVSRLWYGLVNDQQLWKRLFHWKFTNSRIMRIGMDRHLAVSKRRRSIAHAKDRGLLTTTAPPPPPSSSLEWVARSLEDEVELPSYATCWKALYKLNYNWLMGQPVVTCLSMDEIQRQDLRQITRAQQGDGNRPLPQLDLFKTKPMFSEPLVQFMGSILATATNTPWGPMVHFWRLVRGTNHHESNTREAATKAAASGDGDSDEDDSQRLRIEYWQTFVCPKPAAAVGVSDNSSHDSCPSRQKIVTFELDRSRTRCKASQQQQQHQQRHQQQEQQEQTILAMVGYQSGDFTIFQVDMSTATSITNNTLANPTSAATPIIREVGTWRNNVASDKNSILRSSCFHYPLVVTYCADGTLSIFKIANGLEKGAATVSSSPAAWCRLLHQMHGRVGESPVEMEVEEKVTRPQHHVSNSISSSGSTRWLVRLAFGVPLLFDRSWTVRLQEFELDDYRILDCIEIGSGNYHHQRQRRRHPSRRPAFADWDLAPASGSDQHGMADMDIEETLVEEEHFDDPHTLATVAPIASISLASPYLVTTHRDNTMNVFRIRRRPRRRPQYQAPLAGTHQNHSTIDRLEFWHMSTLYGHCGAVSSASIDARLGRLVSASMDRSVKIWRIGKSDGHDDDETMSTTPMHRYYHRQEHQHKPVPSASMIAQEMEKDMHDDESERMDEPWPFEDDNDDDDDDGGYDPDCLVSMSVNANSWVRSKKINRDEGVGLTWIGSDDEKIVSVSVDGMIRVWRFT